MRILKKILFLMAVCGLQVTGGHQIYAETIGQKEAKAMAQKFFNESKNYVTPPVSYVYNGKDLTTQRLFTPFYVFNSPSGGFVSVTEPVDFSPVGTKVSTLPTCTRCGKLILNENVSLAVAGAEDDEICDECKNKQQPPQK